MLFPVSLRREPWPKTKHQFVDGWRRLQVDLNRFASLSVCVCFPVKVCVTVFHFWLMHGGDWQLAISVFRAFWRHNPPVDLWCAPIWFGFAELPTTNLRSSWSCSVAAGEIESNVTVQKLWSDLVSFENDLRAIVNHFKCFSTWHLLSPNYFWRFVNKRNMLKERLRGCDHGISRGNNCCPLKPNSTIFHLFGQKQNFWSYKAVRTWLFHNRNVYFSYFWGYHSSEA